MNSCVLANTGLFWIIAHESLLGFRMGAIYRAYTGLDGVDIGLSFA